MHLMGGGWGRGGQAAAIAARAYAVSRSARIGPLFAFKMYMVYTARCKLLLPPPPPTVVFSTCFL